MASILETFLILFETDAPKAKEEITAANTAAEKLADTLDKVGKIDPSNVEAIDAAMKEAGKDAQALQTALEEYGKVNPAGLKAAISDIEKALEDTTGETGKLRDGLDKAGDELRDAKAPAEKLTDEIRKSDREADKLGRSLEDTGRKLAKLVAAYVGFRTVATVVGNGFREIIELGERASRYNFNVEGLLAFGGVLEDMGGNAEDAERYIRRFSDAIRAGFGDAGSEAGKVLAAMGVNAADANGNLRDTEAILYDISGALEGVSRRTAIDRLRRLGIVDPAMIKLVLQNRQELEKLMVAEKAKGVVTQEAADKARALKMAMDDVKDVAMGLFSSLVSSLAPALTTVAKGLETGAKWLGRHTTLLQGFGIAIAAVAAVITAVFLPAIWAAAIGVLATTWPLILLIALIAALAAAFALAYEDVMFFLKGQPSLIGELAAKYEWFATLVRLVGEAFQWIGQVGAATFALLGDLVGWLATLFSAWAKQQVSAWRAVFDFIGDRWRELWAVAGPVVRLIMDIVGALASLWIQHMQGMWSVAKTVFGALWPYIEPVFSLIMGGLAGLRDVWGAAMGAIGGAWGLLGDHIASVWTATIDRVIAGVQRAIDWIRKMLNLRTDAEAKAPPPPPDVRPGRRPPGSPGGTAAAVGRGQGALRTAGASPLAAQTAAAVSNRANTSSRTTNVNIDKVEVATAATDADGMAKAASGALSTQLRRASADFDDGQVA